MSLFTSHSPRALALLGLGFIAACGSPASGGGTDGADALPVALDSTTIASHGQRRASTPSVSGISPSTLPTSGGTTIAVNGSNFVSGLAVTIGGTSCHGVAWVDATHLTCKTPAQPAGSHDVVVTNPNGRTSGSSGVGMYLAVGAGGVVVGPTTSLRGANLVGMEGDYGFNQANGPIPNTEYAVHSNQIIDYLAAKNAKVIRFLFSWERMQKTLNGPIPAATLGNYKAYFDDYERVVDYATNVKGMTVIVEPWQASPSGGAGGPSWRGNVVGGGVLTSAHFADFWSKMAAIHASNPRVAIGLVNEPNTMSTMTWFAAAQAAVTAIRSAGFNGDIHVPGNGWTGAATWTDASVDAAATKRSSAYGWLNARGAGLPLLDPKSRLVVGVHAYADPNASGGATAVVSGTISRARVKVAVDWARANGLRVFVGEIGTYAGAANATADWADFVSYMDANADTLLGFAWWGCGKPGWWDDVGASGGGHFSITPTSAYTADTVNMKMIAGSLR